MTWREMDEDFAGAKAELWHGSDLPPLAGATRTVEFWRQAEWQMRPAVDRCMHRLLHDGLTVRAAAIELPLGGNYFAALRFAHARRHTLLALAAPQLATRPGRDKQLSLLVTLWRELWAAAWLENLEALFDGYAQHEQRWRRHLPN